MVRILPVSDLRNYNEVLRKCRKGEPLDFEDDEHEHAEKKLLLKLQEAEEAVKDGEGWLNLDELKALVGE